MKHTALLFALATFTAHVASATPRYFGDPGMVLRPNNLTQLGAGDSDPAGVDVAPAPVPEPCSAILLPLGGAAVLWARRRRPGSPAQHKAAEKLAGPATWD